MGKSSNLGLVLAIAAAFLVSCTQESVMGESTPQVTNPTISLKRSIEIDGKRYQGTLLYFTVSNAQIEDSGYSAKNF